MNKFFKSGPFFASGALCAISNDTQAIIFKTLKELQPYHWTDTYYEEITEHWQKI